MYFRPLFFTASNSRSGVLERTEDRRHGGGDMLAVLQRRDGQPRVAGRVGGDEHRLDRVVLDHLLARRIGLFAAAGLCQRGTARGNQIRDRDHLDVRVVLETERRAELAQAVSGDADADLPVGKRLPALLPRSDRPASFRSRG